MAQVNGFKGRVGVAIRELIGKDYYNLCENKTYFNETLISLSNRPLNFTSRGPE